jgi:hypothetical protein
MEYVDNDAEIAVTKCEYLIFKHSETAPSVRNWVLLQTSYGVS